jgi:alcohol dehydrogenase
MQESSPVFQFDAPNTILHGAGALNQLPQLIAALGAERVLIVTDPGIAALGVVDRVVGLLDGAGIEHVVFDEVQPDPTVDNVNAGVEVLESFRADCVVGLGGGSPLDAAKVIAIRSTNPEPLSAFAGLHRIKNMGLPVIAVPTTAGTGSEATKVAVITDTLRNVKMMMLSRPLMPTAAIVDYELSSSMPAGLTAAVGVDTLTHGIEAYVSAKANALTAPLALECVRLCAQHLVTAWREPHAPEARAGMALAATLGGMAFSNSSVCLVHGMSRPLGAVFHLPHGLSNAILLPTVTRFSWEAAAGRYADIARVVRCATLDLPDERACENLVEWLEDLNRVLCLPRLSQCPGVERANFDANLEKMSDDALASGSPMNNPRVPTREQISSLYSEVW